MVSPVGAEWESHTSAPRHVCRLGLLLILARVADLQAEVVSLRGHKDYCERATLSLLQELRRVQAIVQLQDSELKKLKQELHHAAWGPEKEALEVRHLPAGRQLIPTHRPGSPIPRCWAAASWTLSPGQCCCPGWEPRESPSAVSAGPAVRAQACTQPTPSSLQFPSPQNQNKMQALDKRYPHAGVQVSAGGKGVRRAVAGAGPLRASATRFCFPN